MPLLSTLFSTETTLSTSSLSLLSETNLTKRIKEHNLAFLTIRFAEEYTTEIQNEDHNVSRTLLEEGQKFIKELEELGFNINLNNDVNNKCIMAIITLNNDKISNYLNNDNLKIPLLIDPRQLENLWYRSNNSNINNISNGFNCHYICFDSNLFKMDLFYKPSPNSMLYSESTQLKVMHHIFTKVCNLRNLIQIGLVRDIFYLHNKLERQLIDNNLYKLIEDKKMLIQLKDYFGEEYAINYAFFCNILEFMIVYTLITFASMYFGTFVIIFNPFVTLTMIHFWQRESHKLCSSFGLYHYDNNKEIINSKIIGKLLITIYIYYYSFYT
jgi:hypothetical protein